MTMDDGYRPDIGGDVSDIVARAKGWMRTHNIPMSQLEAQGISAADMRRFQEVGNEQLMENMGLLQQLAIALNAPVDYLITGAFPLDLDRAQKIRLRTWQLLEEFAKRIQMKNEIATRFMRAVMKKVEHKITAFPSDRYQPEIPETLGDVHRMYNEWKALH